MPSVVVGSAVPPVGVVLAVPPTVVLLVMAVVVLGAAVVPLFTIKTNTCLTIFFNYVEKRAFKT